MYRRVQVLVAAAIATLAINLVATDAPAVSAESLVAELLATRVSLTMSEWRTRVRGASWQRYRGEIARLEMSPQEDRSVWPSGLWCAVATDHNENVERIAVFFAVRNWTPLACRLELVQGVVRGTPQQTAALYRELSQLMARRVGADGWVPVPGQRDIPAPWGGATGFPTGVTGWREMRGWEVAQGDIYIFRADEAVGFALRSNAIRGDEDDGAPFDVSAFVTSELSNALQPRFPAAAEAFSLNEVTYQTETRQGLLQTLRAMSDAKGSDRAMLTLASDRLARRLWIEGEAPRKQPGLAPILKFGLRFAFDSHQSLWIYDGALARQALRESPQSSWGELAFVTRLQEGWSEGCNGQEYKAVIRQGLTWLPLHPRSPWRVQVMTAVAQAYETQWAGGAFFTVDPAQNARATDASFETARRQAVVWYERVLRLAPGSADAAYARRRIVQIKLNMNTGQERFSCFIP